MCIFSCGMSNSNVLWHKRQSSTVSLFFLRKCLRGFIWCRVSGLLLLQEGQTPTLISSSSRCVLANTSGIPQSFRLVPFGRGFRTSPLDCKRRNKYRRSLLRTQSGRDTSILAVGFPWRLLTSVLCCCCFQGTCRERARLRRSSCGRE